MFAQAKELIIAVQELIDIIAALGERNAEISARNIFLVRLNAVHRADIRRIFFGRKQFLAVVREQLEILERFSAVVLYSVDNPFARAAFRQGRQLGVVVFGCFHVLFLHGFVEYSRFREPFYRRDCAFATHTRGIVRARAKQQIFPAQQLEDIIAFL